MIIKKIFFVIISLLSNYICFSQNSSGFKQVYSDKMPTLPETVTTKREYNKDSTFLLLINERKYPGQNWQTYFECAYFRKTKSLINGQLIFGCSGKGLNFKYSWIDQNNIKVIVPKGLKYFKKNTIIRLGRDSYGGVINGVKQIDINVSYEERQ